MCLLMHASISTTFFLLMHVFFCELQTARTIQPCLIYKMHSYITSILNVG